MRVLLLALLLAALPVVAQDPNPTPQVNVIIVVLTSTNQLPLVLKAITNQYTSTVIIKQNPKVAQLETQIRLMEGRFKENYDGLPNDYIGDGSAQSQATLDKLIALWKQKETDTAEIEAKKDELKKLLE